MGTYSKYVLFIGAAGLLHMGAAAAQERPSLTAKDIQNVEPLALGPAPEAAVTIVAPVRSLRPVPRARLDPAQPASVTAPAPEDLPTADLVAEYAVAWRAAQVAVAASDVRHWVQRMSVLWDSLGARGARDLVQAPDLRSALWYLRDATQDAGFAVTREALVPEVRQ